MTRSGRDEGGGRDERLQRRVLEAAAARPDEVPGPPPFLAARVRARAAEAQAAGASAPAQACGALAWRVVPALALGLLVLGVWTGLETARADRVLDEAASSLVEEADLVSSAFAADGTEHRGDVP